MTFEARRLARPVFWILLAAYLAGQLAFAVRTHFMPAENDILGIISVARGLTITDWSSFHNDFFAAGLPILLALLPEPHVLAIAAIISLAFAGLTLLALFGIVARLTTELWALAGALLVSLTPLFVDYAASAGPDVIALGVCTLALAWLTREAMTRQDPRWWVLLGTGLLFGLAGLIRYHTLILGLAVLVWAFLASSGPRRWRPPAIALLGLVIGFLPQIALNLLGGYGPLEIGSAFYVYESALGVNWFDTASIPAEAYSSVVRVIVDHPGEVAAGYLLTLTSYIVPMAALAVAVAVTTDHRRRTVLIGLLTATIAYALTVSIASSPRGPIATLPMVAIGLAVVADQISARLPQTLGRQRILIGCLAVLVIGWPLLREDAFMLQEKAAHAAERAEAEAALVAAGGIVDASEVLTNDFDLYFTAIPGGLPDRIGGWQDISLNGDRAHDTVDLTSIVAFHCDARRRGITTVLWRDSQLPFMDAGLSGALNGGSQTPRLVNTGRIGPYSVTGITSEGDC